MLKHPLLQQHSQNMHLNDCSHAVLSNTARRGDVRQAQLRHAPTNPTGCGDAAASALLAALHHSSTHCGVPGGSIRLKSANRGGGGCLCARAGEEARQLCCCEGCCRHWRINAHCVCGCVWEGAGRVLVPPNSLDRW